MSPTQQKYALITGASSGIGYAMTVALSKRGYKVFACAPESVEFELKPLEKECGAIIFTCDVTNLDDIKKAVQLVKDTNGGRLDILYNNAGVSIGGPAIEIEEDQLNKIFQVNVIGHINVTKHMSEFVIKTKGTIVFTSSVCTIVPLSWLSAYNATKAAINMYAKTLHAEMKPLGVRVHSVITGGVDTAICDYNRTTTLKSNSHYEVEGVYDSLNASAGMSRNPRTTEQPHVYAEGIADKITKSKDPGFNLFKGSKAWTLYFLALVAPLFVVHWVIGFHFKQLKVFRNIRNRLRHSNESPQ